MGKSNSKRRKHLWRKSSSECSCKSKLLLRPSSRSNASTSDVPHAAGLRRTRKPPTKAAHDAKNDHESHAAPKDTPGPGKYPYPTVYNDHFETPERAYEDIFPLLEYVLESRKQRQTPEGEAVIYDPYFCTGRAATLLKSQFRRHQRKQTPSTVRIQHEKRDFYHDVRQNSVPEYDILVTNPPYSGNHKERCLEFAVGRLKKTGRPFFLLLPNYVATKEYFRKIVLEGGIHMLYVAPPAAHPYEYDHPEDTGHDVPPFTSTWFCGLGGGRGAATAIPAATSAFSAFHRAHAGAPRLAASLRELVRVGGVSEKRRKNPRQRRKRRQQAMLKSDTAPIVADTASNGDARRKPKRAKESRVAKVVGPHKERDSK